MKRLLDIVRRKPKPTPKSPRHDQVRDLLIRTEQFLLDSKAEVQKAKREAIPGSFTALSVGVSACHIQLMHTRMLFEVMKLRDLHPGEHDEIVDRILAIDMENL